MKLPPSVSKFSAAFCIAIALSGACLLGGIAPAAVAQSETGFTYNGVVRAVYGNNDLGTSGDQTYVQFAEDSGSNYVAITVEWFVQTNTSTTIAPSSTQSATDAQIIAAIQQYHDLGIKVFLKPHVDLIDYSSWRGELAPSSVSAWFTSYQDYIVHYAQLARQYNVDGLSIGTELKSLSGSDNLSYWQTLISAVRAAYSGPIVYGANATGPGDEFTTVSFWSLVDIIGVDGYFGLTDQDDPTVAQLEAAWTASPKNGGFNAVAALKNLASQYNKPLVFTEVGYESSKGTNEEPYAQLDNGYDPTEQEDCYTAFFTIFSKQTSWMKGVFWWALQLPVPGADDQGWVMYSKPAGAVMTKWYEGDTSKFALAPSSSTLAVGQGLSAPDTISVRDLGAFTGSVTLSAIGLPAGVTAAFATNPTAGASVLTLTAAAKAAIKGPVTITVKGASGQLTASTTIALTVQAAMAQTIAFANPGTQTVGTPLTLAATATSGLPVSYASTTATVCTVSNSTGLASFLAAGTCSITASQPGNGVYSAAAPVSQTFTVMALPPVPVPATADVIVSQVNWLSSLAGNAFASGNPDGSSMAVNSAGQIVVANTNNLVLFNSQTGATTTLGPWGSASAVAVDSKNNIYVGNLYGPLNFVVKLPYVSGAYAPFSTPTTGTAACTATSTTECVVQSLGSINPGAMTFDAAGDLFWVTANNGATSGNGIWECTAACLGGSGAPIQLYQEPTAAKPPSATSGQLLAGSLAVDPWGNVFFTDSSIYVNTSTYAITSFYSDLNELPTSTAAGYDGVKTGYAASPTVLFTVTPPTPGQYDNELDAVAISPTTGTVFFADIGDGVFAFPNSGGEITLAKGQPTALYAVSTQGAKTLALDGQGNLYLAVYSNVINSSGGDTVAQITVDSVKVPSSAVGTAVSPSATLNPVTTLVNDSACSSTPAPAVTFAATASTTATATVSTTGKCAATLSGGGAFATTVSFTPSVGGTDSIALTGTDQAKHTAKIAVAGTGTTGTTAQKITFANPGTQTVGKPLTLVATSSSGLTVSFASTTTKVCTVSGATATFLAAGTCTIRATQAGSAKYAPAPPVSDSFTVNAAPGFTLTPSAATLSVSQGASATDTLTVKDAGTFTGSVTLAASGLPTGVTAAFATNPTSATSVLKLTASATATAGKTTVTIKGASGTLTASTTITLTVTAAP